jgi:hypothetical protein
LHTFKRCSTRYSMNSHLIIGRWRITPDSIGSLGDYAMEFTGLAELHTTTPDPDGNIMGCSPLSYRVEGITLITEQFGSFHEDRTFVWFEGDKLIVIDKNNGTATAFVREAIDSDDMAVCTDRFILQTAMS